MEGSRSPPSWTTESIFRLHEKTRFERRNLSTGEVEASFDWTGASNFLIRLTPEARYGFVLGGPSKGCMVELPSGECLWQRPEIAWTAFSGDGSKAFVNADEGKPWIGELIDVTTGNVIGNLPQQLEQLGGIWLARNAALSANGEKLAIADKDGNVVFIWDVSDLTQPIEIVGGDSATSWGFFAISPDFQWMLGAGSIISVWPLVHSIPMQIGSFLLGGNTSPYPFDRNNDHEIDVSDRLLQLLHGY